jgi:hypothetical protein
LRTKIPRINKWPGGGPRGKKRGSATVNGYHKSAVPHVAFLEAESRCVAMEKYF